MDKYDKIIQQHRLEQTRINKQAEQKQKMRDRIFFIILILLLLIFLYLLYDLYNIDLKI
jgi:cell division protein FtsB